MLSIKIAFLYLKAQIHAITLFSRRYLTIQNAILHIHDSAYEYEYGVSAIVYQLAKLKVNGRAAWNESAVLSENKLELSIENC